MGKALMKVIMKLVTSAINIVLLPVNLLLEPLFPQSLVNAITNFSNLLNRIGSIIGYVGNFLPPIFKDLILLAMGITIVYYTISWSYTLIVKIYNVIQKIKFW